jgi:predicted dehydrogenase
MGITHADAFSKLPGVELAAVCSTNERVLAGDLSSVGGNLDRSPAKLDFTALAKYQDWRELIADVNVDAVDICLPTDLHRTVVTAALEAGKHVLCEKPMALSNADCEAMLDAAGRARRVLMIAQVLRFWPEYRELHRFVKDRDNGRVLQATFTRSCGLPDWSRWLPVEARSGGAVLDLLVHDIDQILLLFGLPHKVAAKSLGGPDTISSTFLYPGGPEVRLQGGWFDPKTPFSMGFQVRTERAELELSAEGLFLSNAAGKREKIQPQGQDAYETELAYFVDCCRNNRQPELCPPRESAAAVNVALLLKQSRTNGGEQLQCLV